MASKCLSLLLVLTAFIAPAVYADQNDSRLETLFINLKQEDAPGAAQLIELQIWDIWVEHENPQARGLMQRGIQQMNINDVYGALDTFDDLIRMEPEFAEAWNKRATINYLVGDYQASKADIEKTLALEPYHFGALSGLGLVNIAQGDFLQARRAFLSCLEVYPAMQGPASNLRALDEFIQQSL